MSEQEEIRLFERIRENIANAQRKMMIRKAKLGENVIIADDEGNPFEISAEDALKLYRASNCKDSSKKL